MGVSFEQPMQGTAACLHIIWVIDLARRSGLHIPTVEVFNSLPCFAITYDWTDDLGVPLVSLGTENLVILK